MKTLIKEPPKRIRPENQFPVFEREIYDSAAVTPRVALIDSAGIIVAVNTDWLALAGPPPRPLMEFDNVEAMKSVVAVGLGVSIVPSQVKVLVLAP